MLYVFTAIFPFGEGIEVFLEEEIEYLSKSFEKVIIVPFSGSGKDGMRSVPSNCVSLPPIIHNRKRQYLKALLGIKRIGPFLVEFFSKGVLFSRTRMRNWLISYIHLNCVFQSKQWRMIFKGINNNDVLYFYWGRNENAITAFIGDRIKCVSRFHGEWDLWEESSGGYIPLREKVAKNLSLAVFISQKGEMYFKDKYPVARTLISRLGSSDYGIAKKSMDGIFRVVSCSSVYSLKRVPLIYQSLLELPKSRVEWTHIGDGEDLSQLKAFIEHHQSEHVRVFLKGWLNHDDVMQYYMSHEADLFINLSTNEGIPVSIMEAISFNIPIVATNVGGTSEIVNEETGVLVSPDPNPSEVVDAILRVQQSNLSPRSFWQRYYNSSANYSVFADRLKDLSEQ